ncbi:hypothetical protein QWJ90_06820 [Microbacterium oryzae]|uniref:DUF7882 family protein n=1 Tax=Microbacterium oryzae TaxID=743009 RepID=UPI0025B21B87|nr:hypothetical protein [Microbacterium oryzae]MDN3310638.1 hypothetical protein [Microbacterium oryzae]
MGVLYYDTTLGALRVDDRTLQHLKTVIITKLRRGEKFALSWDAQEDGGRPTTIWIDPAIQLRFEFDSPEPAELNQQWLRRMTDSVTLHGGIHLVSEHPTE